MLPQSICGRSQGLVMSAAGTVATTVCCKNSLKYGKMENFLAHFVFCNSLVFMLKVCFESIFCSLMIFVYCLAKRTPFKISFYSDNWENTATANGEALKSAGFRLGYVQTSC